MVSKRYPNRRPSDAFPDLSDYDAFQLDAALAFKYSNIEREDNLEFLHYIVQNLIALRQANGEKKIELVDYERQFLERPKTEEELLKELPTISELIKQHGG